MQSMLRFEVETIEAILAVGLAQARRAKFRVSSANKGHDSFQGASKLHGFRRRVWESGVVERRPTPVPGMVAEKAWFAIAFVFDGCRPQHQFGFVLDKVVGQDHPEAIFHESGQFFSYEVSVLGCRFVASSLDASVSLFHCPGLGRSLGRDSFVSPLS